MSNKAEWFAGEILGQDLTVSNYWFHSCEAYAIRQLLGHGNLPEFVGNMTQAIYRTET